MAGRWTREMGVAEAEETCSGRYLSAVLALSAARVNRRSTRYWRSFPALRSGQKLATGVLGVVFTLLYMLSHSLYLPMVLHALIDLRVLALVLVLDRHRPGAAAL